MSYTQPPDLGRKPRVLLVDDDETIHRALPHFAKHFGVELDFFHAHDVQEGIECLNKTCFDAAVIDVILPGVTGAQLGALVREQDSRIPMAYLTNLDSDTVKTEATSHQALYLFKQHFIGSDDGMKRLLLTITELAKLNPCLAGGIRIDKEGFPRKLPTTPLQMPDPFSVLLNHSKSVAKAAA